MSAYIVDSFRVRALLFFHRLTFNRFRCDHAEWQQVGYRREWSIRCTKVQNHADDHKFAALYSFNGGIGINDTVEQTRRMSSE